MTARALGSMLSIVVIVGPGCFLERAPIDPQGQLDSGMRSDGGRIDAGGTRDGGRDAGRADAGRDARVEVPPDGGQDAGRDAGPPPELPITDRLLVHFDARDVAGDGSVPSSSPSRWVDLTGGNDGACTNVVYEPDGLGPGRPAIFTSGNAGSRCEFPIPNFDNDLTIAVVMRTSDTRTETNWYDSPVIVGGDRFGDHEDAAFYLSAGRPGFARRSGGLQFQSASEVADDMPHVLAIVRGGDGAIALRVDSGALETGTSDTGNIRDRDVWYLASHESDWAGRFACRYAEVLVYDRGLSDAEVVLVRDYLQRRWGL